MLPYIPFSVITIRPDLGQFVQQFPIVELLAILMVCSVFWEDSSKTTCVGRFFNACLRRPQISKSAKLYLFFKQHWCFVVAVVFTWFLHKYFFPIAVALFLPIYILWKQVVWAYKSVDQTTMAQIIYQMKNNSKRTQTILSVFLGAKTATNILMPVLQILLCLKICSCFMVWCERKYGRDVSECSADQQSQMFKTFLQSDELVGKNPSLLARFSKLIGVSKGKLTKLALFLVIFALCTYIAKKYLTASSASETARHEPTHDVGRVYAKAERAAVDVGLALRPLPYDQKLQFFTLWQYYVFQIPTANFFLRHVLNHQMQMTLFNDMPLVVSPGSLVSKILMQIQKDMGLSTSTPPKTPTPGTVEEISDDDSIPFLPKPMPRGRRTQTPIPRSRSPPRKKTFESVPDKVPNFADLALYDEEEHPRPTSVRRSALFSRPSSPIVPSPSTTRRNSVASSEEDTLPADLFDMPSTVESQAWMDPIYTASDALENRYSNFAQYWGFQPLPLNGIAMQDPSFLQGDIPPISTIIRWAVEGEYGSNGSVMLVNMTKIALRIMGAPVAIRMPHVDNIRGRDFVFALLSAAVTFGSDPDSDVAFYFNNVVMPIARLTKFYKPSIELIPLQKGATSALFVAPAVILFATSLIAECFGVHEEYKEGVAVGASVYTNACLHHLKQGNRLATGVTEEAVLAKWTPSVGQLLTFAGNFNVEVIPGALRPKLYVDPVYGSIDPDGDSHLPTTLFVHRLLWHFGKDPTRLVPTDVTVNFLGAIAGSMACALELFSTHTPHTLHKSYATLESGDITPPPVILNGYMKSGVENGDAQAGPQEKSPKRNWFWWFPTLWTPSPSEEKARGTENREQRDSDQTSPSGADLESKAKQNRGELNQGKIDDLIEKKIAEALALDTENLNRTKDLLHDHIPKSVVGSQVNKALGRNAGKPVQVSPADTSVGDSNVRVEKHLAKPAKGAISVQHVPIIEDISLISTKDFHKRVENRCEKGELTAHEVNLLKGAHHSACEMRKIAPSFVWSPSPNAVPLDDVSAVDAYKTATRVALASAYFADRVSPAEVKNATMIRDQMRKSIIRDHMKTIPFKSGQTLNEAAAYEAADNTVHVISALRFANSSADPRVKAAALVHARSILSHSCDGTDSMIRAFVTRESNDIQTTYEHLSESVSKELRASLKNDSGLSPEVVDQRMSRWSASPYREARKLGVPLIDPPTLVKEYDHHARVLANSNRPNEIKKALQFFAASVDTKQAVRLANQRMNEDMRNINGFNDETEYIDNRGGDVHRGYVQNAFISELMRLSGYRNVAVVTAFAQAHWPQLRKQIAPLPDNDVIRRRLNAANLGGMSSSKVIAAINAHAGMDDGNNNNYINSSEQQGSHNVKAAASRAHLQLKMPSTVDKLGGGGIGSGSKKRSQFNRNDYAGGMVGMSGQIFVDGNDDKLGLDDALAMEEDWSGDGQFADDLYQHEIVGGEADNECETFNNEKMGGRTSASDGTSWFNRVKRDLFSWYTGVDHPQLQAMVSKITPSVRVSNQFIGNVSNAMTGASGVCAYTTRGILIPFDVLVNPADCRLPIQGVFKMPEDLKARAALCVVSYRQVKDGKVVAFTVGPCEIEVITQQCSFYKSRFDLVHGMVLIKQNNDTWHDMKGISDRPFNFNFTPQPVVTTPVPCRFVTFKNNYAFEATCTISPHHSPSIVLHNVNTIKGDCGSILVDNNNSILALHTMGYSAMVSMNFAITPFRPAHLLSDAQEIPEVYYAARVALESAQCDGVPQMQSCIRATNRDMMEVILTTLPQRIMALRSSSIHPLFRETSKIMLTKRVKSASMDDSRPYVDLFQSKYVFVQDLGSKAFLQDKGCCATVMSELGGVACSWIQKNSACQKEAVLQKADSALMEKWKSKIFEKSAAVDAHAKSLGWKRCSDLPFDDTMIMSLIEATATNGTTGGAECFISPHRASTKSEMSIFILDGGQRAFVDHIKDVHSLMLGGSCDGIPVMSYPKDDGYKFEKAWEGRHRVINMPPWSVTVVESYYSHWCKPAPGLLEICSLDDVMAELRRVNTNHQWLFGGDMAQDLLFLHRDAIDYDVRAWDQSLPGEIIDALYAATTAQPKIAEFLSHALCGGGTYCFSGFEVAMPKGCRFWCSGALKTLSGNSLIHAALLEALGLDGIVCGDDANVFSDVSLVELEKSLASLGLKTKHCRKVSGLNFCCMSTTADGVVIDRSKILDRAAAALCFQEQLDTVLASLQAYQNALALKGVAVTFV